MINIKWTWSQAAMLLVIASFVTFVGLLQHLAQFHHVTSRTCKPYLCLFTTFRPGVYKIAVTSLHRVSKKVPTFKVSVALSNLIRFSQYLHCWKAYKVCYKTRMTLHRTHWGEFKSGHSSPARYEGSVE